MTETAATETAAKPMTREETDALYREMNERAKRIGERAEAAITAANTQSDFLCLMTRRQEFRLAYLVREAITTADYFGKEETEVSIKVEEVSKGRKGSPNKSFWVTIDVKCTSRTWGGAFLYGSIGKRGAIKVTVHDRSLSGRERKLGKGW